MSLNSIEHYHRLLERWQILFVGEIEEAVGSNQEAIENYFISLVARALQIEETVVEQVRNGTSELSQEQWETAALAILDSFNQY